VANNNGYPGADGKPKGDPNKHTPITFDDFAKFVSEYTLDKAHELSGVPKDKLEALAKAYADPKVKVTSYWTMGFNQHTRGTWVNNMIYNVHLLVGKISEPGNSPFSLTGQPSACGTAREVGTFAHRLPADMVVTNPKHREHRREALEAAGRARFRTRSAITPWLQSRMLKDGKIGFYWTTTTNNMQAGPNVNGEIYPGLAQPEGLRGGVRRLSDRVGNVGRPDPALRDVDGKGRHVRQRRAPRPDVAPAGQGAGRGQVRSVAVHGVLQALQDGRGLAGRAAGQEPEYKGKTLYDVLYANGQVNKFPKEELAKVNAHAWAGYTNDESEAFGFYVQKGLFEEYAAFGRGHAHDLAPFDVLSQGARPALAGGGWQGNPVALPRGLRPVREEGRGREVLRLPRRQGQDLCAALPARRRECRTRSSTCGCAPAACWSTGTPAR
jgi:nitrate reductase NapA